MQQQVSKQSDFADTKLETRKMAIRIRNTTRRDKSKKYNNIQQRKFEKGCSKPEAKQRESRKNNMERRKGRKTNKTRMINEEQQKEVTVGTIRGSARHRDYQAREEIDETTSERNIGNRRWEQKVRIR